MSFKASIWLCQCEGVDSVVVFLVAVIVHPSIHVAEELDSLFSLLSGLVHLLRR